MVKSLQKLKKAITYQWHIKLYVIGLAFALWFFTVNNQVYETVIGVELVPIGTKAGKIIVSEIPQEAQVRFSGLGKDLLIMKYLQPPRLELDIHTINHYYEYPLRTGYVITPTGLNVTAEEIIDPLVVEIRLENLDTTYVPVIPNVEVLLQSGYMLASGVDVEPDSVMAVGPRSIIRELGFFETEAQVYTDVMRPSRYIVSIQVPDSRYLTVFPLEVNVILDVDQIAERMITRIPVGAVRIPRGRRVQIEPSRVDVTVKGPARILATLTEDSLDATVNLRRWTPEQQEYIPQFELPELVELVRCQPEMVRVRVEEAESR